MGHSVIHIGANKTASTTLQRALFKDNHQLQYLGEDGDGYADYASLVNSLVSDDDLFYPSSACVDSLRSGRPVRRRLPHSGFSRAGYADAPPADSSAPNDPAPDNGLSWL
jgi:hypothetical protein